LVEYILYAIILVWALSRYYWYFNWSNEEVYEDYTPDQFARYDLILKEKLPYYSKLSDSGKLNFVGRLIHVMERVPIIGREGINPTESDKVFIAGSITQLTFGFNKPNIPFLKGIILYPEAFYSKLFDAWVKGLSMGNGYVLLSYADFEEGYRDTADTYNLGLHEFAHVLRFQANETSLFDERLSAYFSEWEKAGQPVFMRTRTRQEDFFRAYGGTNSSEFFSVCVENFFEVPELFKQELPELFYHLCYLLKQNPLNTTNDFVFDESEVKEVNQHFKTNLPIYKIWHTQYELIVLESADTFIAVFGIVAGVTLLFTSPEHRNVSFRLLAGSTAIFLLVRWYYYQNIRAIVNKQYLAYFFFKLIPVLAFINIIWAAWSM